MGRRKWIESVMRNRDGSAKASAMRSLLLAGTVPYAVAVGLRNRSFDHRLRSVTDLGRPTISVGNLTTGGTGKTPMVTAIAQMLQEMGHTPGVLLRGYQAQAGQRSDEEQLYVDSLGEQSVQADPDRVRGAKQLLLRNPQVDVLLLDDGFQHRRAKRDLDLVLIDATEPWGGGHLLPRGFLREPRANLRRADAVILTRCDQVSSEILGQLESEIHQFAAHLPILRTRHHWTNFRVMSSTGQEYEMSMADLPSEGRRTAICGIGNPDAWNRALEQHHINVRQCVTLPDHHAYTTAELTQWFAAASHAGDAGVLTTEKDWVKWRSLLGEIPEGDRLDIVRPTLSIDWLVGRDVILDLLRRVMDKSSEA